MASFSLTLEKLRRRLRAISNTFSPNINCWTHLEKMQIWIIKFNTINYTYIYTSLLCSLFKKTFNACCVIPKYWFLWKGQNIIFFFALSRFVFLWLGSIDASLGLRGHILASKTYLGLKDTIYEAEEEDPLSNYLPSVSHMDVNCHRDKWHFPATEACCSWRHLRKKICAI